MSAGVPEAHGPPRRRRVPIELVGLLIILLLGAGGWFGVWLWRGYTEPYETLIEPAEGVEVYALSRTPTVAMYPNEKSPGVPIPPPGGWAALADRPVEQPPVVLARCVLLSRFGRELRELKLSISLSSSILHSSTRAHYPVTVELASSGTPIDGFRIGSLGHVDREPSNSLRLGYCFASDLPCRVAGRSGSPGRDSLSAGALFITIDAGRKLDKYFSNPPDKGIEKVLRELRGEGK